MGWTWSLLVSQPLTHLSSCLAAVCAVFGQEQLRTQIKNVLALIEKAETACAALDQEMMAAGSDAHKAMEIHAKKKRIQDKMKLAEQEWEAMESEAEELGKKILFSP